jgi:hypothetical protein
MNITELIKELNVLKSKGITKIYGVDDDWNNYGIEVYAGHDGDREVGYLVISPSIEYELN